MLVDLSESNPPYFEGGDIIRFSFTVTFVIGNEAWAPEYRLLELIRVGKIPEPAGIRSDSSTLPPRGEPLKLKQIVLPTEGPYPFP